MKIRINIKANMFMLLLTAVALSACSREFNPSDGRNNDGQPGNLGRPVIRNNSIYTSWGTRLRGTLTDTGADYPNGVYIGENEFDAMVNNGLNALHLYGDTPDHNRPIESQAAYTDYLIDQAEKRGMYVVLNVGGVNGTPEKSDNNARYINKFWEFYAPRYRDRKHVIFELCNEYGSEISVDYMVRTTAEFYQNVRRLAPNTMIFVWTFSNTIDPEWLLEWLEGLEALVPGGIPWTNEAITIHSYECTDDQKEIHGGETHHRAVIRRITGAGYPLINTEVPGRLALTNYPDMSMYRVLEEEGIAWLSFVDCVRIGVPSYWRGQMEAAGITWKPDYGDWPVPNADFPFKSHGTALSINAGSSIKLSRLNFGTREPLAFVAKVRADAAGTLEIRTADGAVAGSYPVVASAAETYIKVYLLHALNGVTDVELACTSSSGKLQVRDWAFQLPAQDVYSNPYQTVHAANYPFRTGKPVRRVNTDAASAAPLHVGGITHGSSLVFDYVWFDNREVNLHIRARRLAGGKIKIYAGDFASLFPTVFELGECEINGTQGEWAEYVCPLDVSYVYNVGMPYGRWDLHLKFESFAGGGSAELFELSEFVFK